MFSLNPGFNTLDTLQKALPPDWPGNFWWHFIIFTTIVINAVLLIVMGFIYMERRTLGRMQSRLGPNRTGPYGLLQPVADAIKVLLKEDIVPDNADKIVHWLAPVVAFFPTLMIFAVIPFGNGWSLVGDLNVGILYIVAISSISTVGVFMAGWSSSNKYSLLGAMRNVAAVVSYEMPLVLAVASVVLLAGSLSLQKIVEAQNNIPYILLQPMGFLIFFLAASAEINRSPFDLMEADSELVAGFHTEYSGMKFAMFYLVEYAEALAMSAIIATLFLGGWKGILPPALAWLQFLIKVFLVFFLMIWARATLPRVRIDQLMAFSWKFLLPLALINLFLTAIEVLALPAGSLWMMIPVNIAATAVLILIGSKFSVLGRGRVEV